MSTIYNSQVMIPPTTNTTTRQMQQQQTSSSGRASIYTHLQNQSGLNFAPQSQRGDTIHKSNTSNNGSIDRQDYELIDDDSVPPEPPVRDASSLRSIKYGPGHEKFPSWPMAAGADTPVPLRGPPSGGSQRSKSWTDQTNYPKEKIVNYTRPYMKRPHSAFSQKKLKTVLERCEKPAVSDTTEPPRYDMDELYLPRVDREGKPVGDAEYTIPSPPERDIDSVKSQLDVEQACLTQADLEEYGRMYEIQHQKQGSYAQSEGYYSYVSSVESVSTPFLDRLRRDSEGQHLQQLRNWTEASDKDSTENSSSTRSREGRDSVVTTTSSSASSSETLRWHGSLSDVSVASGSNCAGGPPTRQLIAHSARVTAPQRHHSESVLYMSQQQQQHRDESDNEWKERETRNNQRNNEKLKLFPVNTYTVQPSSKNNHRPIISQPMSQSNFSVAERVSELEQRGSRTHDPALRALQKQALLSFYERQVCGSNGNISSASSTSWRSEPQLAQPLHRAPMPPPRPKGITSRRASSASDYAKALGGTAAWRDGISSSDGNKGKTEPTVRHQHSNSCGSLSSDLLGPVILGPAISVDDWVPERPPKKPHLRATYGGRAPSPELPPPPPPVPAVGEVIDCDEPLPPPPTELEVIPDWTETKKSEELTDSYTNADKIETFKVSQKSEFPKPSTNYKRYLDDSTRFDYYSDRESTTSSCHSKVSSEIVRTAYYKKDQNYKNTKISNHTRQASDRLEDPEPLLYSHSRQNSEVIDSNFHEYDPRSKGSLHKKQFAVPQEEVRHSDQEKLRQSAYGRQNKENYNQEITVPPRQRSNSVLVGSCGADRRANFLRSVSNDSGQSAASYRASMRAISAQKLTNDGHRYFTSNNINRNNETMLNHLKNKTDARSDINQIQRYQEKQNAIKSDVEKNKTYQPRCLNPQENNQFAQETPPPLHPRVSKPDTKTSQSKSSYLASYRRFSGNIGPAEGDGSYKRMTSPELALDCATLECERTPAHCHTLSSSDCNNGGLLQRLGFAELRRAAAQHKKVVNNKTMAPVPKYNLPDVLPAEAKTQPPRSLSLSPDTSPSNSLKKKLHSMYPTSPTNNLKMSPTSHEAYIPISRYTPPSSPLKTSPTSEKPPAISPRYTPLTPSPTSSVPLNIGHTPTTKPAPSSLTNPVKTSPTLHDMVILPSKHTIGNKPNQSPNASPRNSTTPTQVVFPLVRKQEQNPENDTTDLQRSPSDKKSPKHSFRRSPKRASRGSKRRLSSPPSEKVIYDSQETEKNEPTVTETIQRLSLSKDVDTNTVISSDTNNSLENSNNENSKNDSDEKKSPTSYVVSRGIETNDGSLSPKVIESLQLIQRTEVVLRVNACMLDAASQTDLNVEDSCSGRQPTPEDLECDRLSADLIKQLPPTDQLKCILAPSINHKKSSDYVSDLYKPEVISRSRPTPSSSPSAFVSKNCTNGVSTSTTVSCTSSDFPSPLSPTSTYFTTSESKAKFLTIYKRDVKQHSSSNYTSTLQDATDLNKKKEELVERLSKKLEVLRGEQVIVSEEERLNDSLGNRVCERLSVSGGAAPHELAKYRLHVEEVGKITSLLLGLSGRLARAHNALTELPPEHSDKKTLEAKRNKLEEQLKEAKQLKKSIDKRSTCVSNILRKYLNGDEYADYDHYINMKAKLIVDAREIADKIELGEEQLLALKETLCEISNT